MTEGTVIAERVLGRKLGRGNGSRKMIYIAHEYEDNHVTVFGSATRAVEAIAPDEWTKKQKREASHGLRCGDVVDIHCEGILAASITQSFLQ